LTHVKSCGSTEVKYTQLVEKSRSNKSRSIQFTFDWSFRMNKLVLSLSLVLAQMLAVSAFAQSKGEADPAQSKAAPAAPATPAEKAAAKSARKAEGAAAAKTETAGDTPSSMGTAKSATKAERKAAAKKRKAAVAASVKKGEIPSGEK